MAGVRGSSACAVHFLLILPGGPHTALFSLNFQPVGIKEDDLESPVHVQAYFYMVTRWGWGKIRQDEIFLSLQGIAQNAGY